MFNFHFHIKALIDYEIEDVNLEIGHDVGDGYDDGIGGDDGDDGDDAVDIVRCFNQWSSALVSISTSDLFDGKLFLSQFIYLWSW